MSWFDDMVDGFLGRSQAPEASSEQIYGGPDNPIDNTQGVTSGNTGDLGGNQSESSSDFEDSGVSGDSTFLWKPVSDNSKTLAILLPSNISASQVTLVDQNGNVVDQGVLSTSGNHPDGRTNGNRLTYRFSRPGGAYNNVTVMVDGKPFTTIGNGSQRIENNNGSVTSGPGGSFRTLNSPYGVSAVLPNNHNAFKDLSAPLLKAQTPPLAPYNYVDPLMSAEATGNFNTEQFNKVIQNSLEKAPGIANEITDFNVAQNDELNEIAQDRLSQRVETQLPGFIRGTQEDLGTARSLARGELPDFIDEEVVFGSTRNSAADIATFSGFGAGSVFGRTATDRMDAQARLGFTEKGMSLTDQIANRAFGTFIDRPVRATEVKPSDLFTSFVNAQLPLNTIDVNTALSSQVNQNQYDTNRLQNYANANASNNQNVDQFNIGNQFSINQAVAQQDQINNGQALNAYQYFLNAANTAAMQQRQLNGLQQQQSDVATRDGINQWLGLLAQYFGLSGSIGK